MDVLHPALISGLIGGIVGGLVGFLVFLIKCVRPVPKCPECGEQLPRWPAKRWQRLWGGWTCPNCGCEVDHKGRKVEG